MRELPAGLVTVDYESAAISAYPDYPPKPCSVAIRWDDGKYEFLAWGHSAGNNCTFEEAQRAVSRAFQFPCVFHNAQFDLEVARVHMGLPNPREWHDTLYMAFLCEPHAPSLSLKSLANRLLQNPPEEKDDVLDYGHRVLGYPRSQVMAHIPEIPADIVGPYAIGDARRTSRLARHFWGVMNERNLWDAYDTERRLAPWLTATERRGVRVDRQLLHEWTGQLQHAILACDARLRLLLKAPELNPDANESLIAALDGAGWVDATWPTTESGTLSVALPVLHTRLPDELYNLLAYRNKSATMLRTFVTPWLEMSEKDGRIHPAWSPVRTPGDNGTRTGRIASFRPNLANVPNKQRVDPPEDLKPLPELRRALLPEEGHVWLSADYSQQELRILAHYEDGDLMQAYQANSRLDLHQYAADLVERRLGVKIDRKSAKILGFSILYGAGIPKVAEQLGVSTERAGELRHAYLKALPGVASLKRDTTRRFSMRTPIRTLGGRVYYAEAPKNGRSFEYRALNYLIQPSAADQTKRAIIAACSAMPHACLVATLYDEICFSVPADSVVEHARKLEAAMVGALPMDVPVCVDMDVGPTWGDYEPLEI